MDNVQASLILHFFPRTREEWREHYPPTTGKKMTREEHISSMRGRIYIFNSGHRASDEEIFKMNPWLRNEEEFAKWQALEPFDRFRFLVGGLPWTDEMIELIKNDDGPIDKDEVS